MSKPAASVHLRGRTVRIGGAAGFWGDSVEAARQLVMSGQVDYLVFDYLAEVTMSILARARAKSPDGGYARDFVDAVIKPLLPEIKARGIRVIANAGGVNLPACAAAVKRVADEAGLTTAVGTVEGDDLLGRSDELSTLGIQEMFSGAALPLQLASANAYLGAFPIAAALDGGADIVITGRCVDSAVTLGVLIHEFGWSANDYHRLAAGTIAGHLLECGAQATGGNFTDWRDVVEGWDNMGYPIVDCSADGHFIISKPPGTGGLVSRLSVGEQLLYEIGDPGAYVVPDVVCDITGATLQESGPDQVFISGIKGHQPPAQYKVSATYHDGYRATSSMVITGFDALEKARNYSKALLARTERLLLERNLGPYRDSATHYIGAETLWGGNARAVASETRELTVRLDVRHDNRAALELFSKETTGVSLAMTPGRCSGGAAGRPKITPVVAQFAFLIDKALVPVTVKLDGLTLDYHPPITKEQPPYTVEPPRQNDDSATVTAGETVTVPLIALAVARSGDKGNDANIGVIVREPEFLPSIRHQLTAERVRQWFSHTLEGEVRRYELPGPGAFNFYLTRCLGGGGTSSVHLDTQAKTYAQQLLTLPIEVPRALATEFGLNRGES